MKLLQGVGAAGGCAEALAYIYLKNVKNGFSTIYRTKSGLRRVRNCVGELAVRFETVASFYVCQPNHSYAVFMFSLYSDTTCAIVVAGVLHLVWSELPHQGSYLQDYS